MMHQRTEPENRAVERGAAGLELFSSLVAELGTATGTNEKLQLLTDYFAMAPDRDKVWVIAIFSGRRPRRTVSSRLMRDWCAMLTGYPSWLIEESYHTVGDLAETLALLLPDPVQLPQTAHDLSHYLETLLLLEQQDETARRQFVTDCWRVMNRDQRFVLNKLITGSFRIGVSQKTIVNALARTTNLPASTIAHRISGNWDPVTTAFGDLLGVSAITADFSKPYPFYLAYALEGPPENLGLPADWQAEWKWDGIRGQIIRRNHELFVWSRGEELMTGKFPEYTLLSALLPEGTVLDGEILPAREGRPLPFSLLQTRIGRKNVGKKQLQEAPIVFFAYDLLESSGQDIRDFPLRERRRLLEEVVSGCAVDVLQVSPLLAFDTWEELAAIRGHSREMNSEGIMLKRKNAPYQAGRKRGDWWKWKIDPLTIDGVMVYAQKGSGRRSNLYTDYTFAVRDVDRLVPFTKAYSGLTDREFSEVDRFVKQHSLEKFGPVRTVSPELVFEIAFEGIASSARHKSGVALRFPRISRWRRDKKPGDINTLDDLKAMLALYGK